MSEEKNQIELAQIFGDKPKESVGPKWVYDPLQSPPDLQLAERHGKAKSVGIISNFMNLSLSQQKLKLGQLCPCCGLDTEIADFSFCCDPHQLSDFGSGYVLLFILMKFLGILMLVLTVVNAFKVYRNLSSNYCFSANDPIIQIIGNGLNLCIQDWITVHSIANYGLTVVDTWDKWIMVIYLILQNCFISAYGVYSKGEQIKIDQINDTPSDWTVMVMNIPSTESDNDIINQMEMISAVHQFTVLPKVEKINSTYKIEAFAKLSEEILNKKKELKLTELKSAKKNKKGKYSVEENESIEQLEEEAADEESGTREKKTKNSPKDNFGEDHRLASEQIKGMVDELDRVKKEMTVNRSEYFNGITFVTFETKQMCDEFTKRFETDDSFISLFLGRRNRLPYTQTIDGQKRQIWLRLKPAPNPTDIIYDNLGIPFKDKVIRRLITSFATLLILGASFGILLGLKVWQRRLAPVGAKLSLSDIDFLALIARLISVGITITIMVINEVISYALRYLTILEKFSTQTGFYSSLLYKIAIAQFINTNIIIVIVHLLIMHPEKPIYAKGGLMIDAWYILISQVVVTPLFQLFSPAKYMKYMFQCLLKRKVANGQAGTTTQADAHLTFEKPIFDPAFAHSTVAKIWCDLLFFQPLFPLSSGLALAAILFIYWTMKHRFLFSSVRPVTISGQIHSICLHLISLSPLVFGISSMIFDKMLRDKIELSSIVIFAVGCLFFLVPVHQLMRPLFKCFMFTADSAEEANFTVPYTKMRPKFFTEYDRSNPITKAAALKQYFAFMKNACKDPEAEAQWKNNFLMSNFLGAASNQAYAGGSSLDAPQSNPWDFLPLEVFGGADLGMNPFSQGYNNGMMFDSMLTNENIFAQFERQGMYPNQGGQYYPESYPQQPPYNPQPVPATNNPGPYNYGMQPAPQNMYFQDPTHPTNNPFSQLGPVQPNDAEIPVYNLRGLGDNFSNYLQAKEVQPETKPELTPLSQPKPPEPTKPEEESNPMSQSTQKDTSSSALTVRVRPEPPTPKPVEQAQPKISPFDYQSIGAPPQIPQPQPLPMYANGYPGDWMGGNQQYGYQAGVGGGMGYPNNGFPDSYNQLPMYPQPNAYNYNPY